MKLIPENVIEEIKIKNDIADVVSSYVTLKRAGSNMTGLCPFHNEKTPSFIVFNAAQNFHCFGCGVGGDVVTFIRRMENLEYVDALKFLAKRVGVTVPEDEREGYGGVRKSRLLELNRAAARFFHQCMKSSPEALGYFAKRKLAPQTIRHFGLGFAPNDWNLFTNAMREQGFTENELISARLCGKSEKNGRLFPYFRNRVMFPILDPTGSVIAFGGRVMDNSEPKYLNSPDTPAFKKSRNLFALNFAKDAVTDKELILCEGYMDVIALHAAGFCNAVATLGTALTQEQARIMKRYADSIVLSYDSDNAGRRAAERAIGILSEVGLEVRVIQTAEAKDPDEFIKKFGADAFRKLIATGASSFDFRLRNILMRYDLNSPDAKLSAAKEICEEAAKTSSHVERELYVMRAAEKLGISTETLMYEVKKAAAKRNSAERKSYIEQLERAQSGAGDKVNPERAANLKAAIAEEAILGILLLFPEKISKFTAPDPPLDDSDFVTAFNRRVYTELKALYSSGSTDISLLGASFSPDEISRIYEIQLRRDGLTSNSDEVLEDNIRALKQSSLDKITDINALIKAKRDLK